jgi:arginine deiminase
MRFDTEDQDPACERIHKLKTPFRLHQPLPFGYLRAMSVHVSSEIGRLRSVVVHSPGPELCAVTPTNRAEFLYDDIIDSDSAQREHRRFLAILERFAKVYQVRDLLADVLANAEARELLIRETMDIVPSEPLARDLSQLDAQTIVRLLIEGREEPPGPLAKALNERGYVLPPLPNLFFTRDSCTATGKHVLIGSMRYAIRWTEAIIMKTIFLHHPQLANEGILYDGASERRVNYTLEGGDVHALRSDLVIIGFSERSSPAGIDQLASLFFERTAIHLDMVFTQVDRELCVVYPPHFIGPERLPVLHWHKGETTLREPTNIFAALKACGMPMEPISCGGRHRTTQEREQWASGCNFVALRPGVVMSYQRNEATLHEMQKMGFRVISGVSFLTGEERIAEGDRAVISFEGSELVRRRRAAVHDVSRAA